MCTYHAVFVGAMLSTVLLLAAIEQSIIGVKFNRVIHRGFPFHSTPYNTADHQVCFMGHSLSKDLQRNRLVPYKHCVMLSPL